MAKDYHLKCKCCGKLFLSYRGAEETRNGNTCISCWTKDSPPVLVKYGEDLLAATGAEPIPEARELFPEDEPGLFDAFDRRMEEVGEP